jgi:poly(3-hydroxybutyrate) depolymerase
MPVVETRRRSLAAATTTITASTLGRAAAPSSSPEGLDAGWRNAEGRDINFVKAMLAQFSAKLCIDQRRIFSAGFSFGGMMSDAIGCAMADVFRAIALMAGGLPTAEHPYSGPARVRFGADDAHAGARPDRTEGCALSCAA